MLNDVIHRGVHLLNGIAHYKAGEFPLMVF